MSDSPSKTCAHLGTFFAPKFGWACNAGLAAPALICRSCLGVTIRELEAAAPAAERPPIVTEVYRWPLTRELKMPDPGPKPDNMSALEGVCEHAAETGFGWLIFVNGTKTERAVCAECLDGLLQEIEKESEKVEGVVLVLIPCGTQKGRQHRRERRRRR